MKTVEERLIALERKQCTDRMVLWSLMEHIRNHLDDPKLLSAYVRGDIEILEYHHKRGD